MGRCFPVTASLASVTPVRHSARRYQPQLRFAPRARTLHGVLCVTQERSVASGVGVLLLQAPAFLDERLHGLQGSQAEAFLHELRVGGELQDA